jgi:hypothetical protein
MRGKHGQRGNAADGIAERGNLELPLAVARQSLRRTGR